MLTIVCSYDHLEGVSSNQVGRYFHEIAGHQNATNFIHEVLKASEEEKFGGNYGESVPGFLNYRFTNGSKLNEYIEQDYWPDETSSSNFMSSLTMAEYLRQIIMTREDKNLNVFNWKDSKSVLYGAEKSEKFEGLQFGGMSMSTDAKIV